MTMSAIFLFTVVVPISSALLLIETNDNATLRLPAYATAFNLGAPVGDYMKTGRLYLFADDACSRDTAAIPDLTDRVVFIQNAYACPNYIPYEAFAAKNATAIIRNTTKDMGTVYALRSMYDVDARPIGDRLAPAFVDLIWSERVSPTMASTLTDGVRIEIRPDLTPWRAVLTSWPYQLVCRWLGAALYFAAFVLALLFLIGHAHHLHRQATTARRPLLTRFHLIHLALVLAVVKGALFTVYHLMGGLFTGDALPIELQLMLSPGLVGVESSILIITARYWHAIISKSDAGSRSRLGSGAVALLIAVVFVGGDVAIAAMIGSYRGMLYPTMRWAILGVPVLTMFVTAVYFVVSLVRFQVRLRRPSTTGAADQRLRAFAQRLSRRAALLTASVFAQCAVLMALGAFSSVQDDPHRFSLCLMVGVVVMSVRSIVTIWILQPRRDAGPATGARPKAGTTESRPLANMSTARPGARLNNERAVASVSSPRSTA